MDLELKQAFLEKWQTYFPGAELPITFEYTDEERGIPLIKPAEETRCMIGVLQKARAGTPLRFNAHTFSCQGGRHYCGFSPHLRSGIEEFLSHDAGGEGERYKKTPQIAAEAIRQSPPFVAPATNLIFKRWDLLSENDNPLAVIFFAGLDVLAGLFTLASFDVTEPDGVITAPFSAGCGSIVKYPALENQKEKPRAVLGMFDVSARPHVPANTLTFSIPMKKFTHMVADMDESFLITDSWEKVRERM
jgi:hypothetical protein